MKPCGIKEEAQRGELTQVSSFEWKPLARAQERETEVTGGWSRRQWGALTEKRCSAEEWSWENLRGMKIQVGRLLVKASEPLPWKEPRESVGPRKTERPENNSSYKWLASR